MKYGVLWRKTTKNIGDDMQSYAESLWYPQVDYMVDVEDLDGFKSEDDEPVATIMSAWYMWHKWNWPPSKYIYPLWIGFHYNDLQRGRPRGMPCKYEYLEGLGYEYFKAHEPIGCRDLATLKYLQEQGIDSYYSSCITLTLPKRPIVKPEREYVCVVGVDKAVERYIKDFYKDKNIDVKVIAPTRPEPSTNLSWEARKAQVEEMLDLYQNAKAVYTFRLHCSMPTLALGTPVLLIRKSFASDRFTPFKDYVHHCLNSELLSGDYDSWMENPPENPDTFLPVRDNLIKIVSEWIEQTKKETRKASELVKTDYTDGELMQWKYDTMKKTLHNYLMEEHQDIRDLQAVQKQLKATEKKLKAYTDLGSAEAFKKYKALGSPKAVEKKLASYERMRKNPLIRLFMKLFYRRK